MIRLSPHGKWEMIVGTLVLAGLGRLLGWLFWPLAFIILPVWVWLIAFFRDPERVIPTDLRIMVSPADGTVSDITDIEHDDRLNGPAVRIGIFLSVFSVHINRSPCAGKVSKIDYREGKFLNALDHANASSDNESNTITLVDVSTGQPIAVVKQIVGLIARRIICTPQIGDSLSRGERIGLIKFGSRTELFIPRRLDPTIKVKIGEKLRGAADIVATLGKELSA